MTRTPIGRRDRAGRWLWFNDDPSITAPAHSWDGDETGHNCRGCPEEGFWRCDKLAHPEHDPHCFMQKEADDDEPLCDCLVWRTIRAHRAAVKEPTKCDHRLKVKWSGMRCDCGQEWECY